MSADEIFEKAWATLGILLLCTCVVTALNVDSEAVFRVCARILVVGGAVLVLGLLVFIWGSE